MNDLPWRILFEKARRHSQRAEWERRDQCIRSLLAGYGLQLQPLLAVAELLLHDGHLDQAERLLSWAHQLSPQDPNPLRLLAAVWLQSLRQDKALRLYHDLMQQWPQLPGLLSAQLMAMAYVPGLSACEVDQQAQLWSLGLIDASRDSPGPMHHQDIQFPTRLAFLSGDLCQHTVGLLLLPLVETLYAQSHFTLSFYSNSPRHDWLTERLQQCGSWCDISALDDMAVAQRIRSDRVDVLVELSGHTARSRLAVCLHRPAPLQLSWLGYWGCTGLDTRAIDGVIADPIVLPPDPSGEPFADPVLRLPHSRWCYRPVPWMPEPTAPPCLHQGFITFGSFNNTTKLNTPLLRLWAAVLRAVPKSRLLLKWRDLQDPELCARLSALMEAEGIHPSRVRLEGPSFHADLLKAYSQVDIALDPAPFNGGLTSCEALWMGVPLLTLQAQGEEAAWMAARQGEALLRVIGRQSWICESSQALVECACELASDPLTLERFRFELRPAMQASPLCDERGFASAFTDLVHDAWSARQASSEHQA